MDVSEGLGNGVEGRRTSSVRTRLRACDVTSLLRASESSLSASTSYGSVIVLGLWA